LLILPAGVETTYRASGNLLVALLTEPSLMEMLRADRGLVRGAIEEALRWEPPISTVVRVATQDCEVGGVAIPAGTNVSVSVAAANRDPHHYPDPDRFDPTRSNIAHLTFGAGPHVCLGMSLARMETAVAINALLDRLPDLRLDPSAPRPVINGVAFRSPAALPVEFTAS
jgi:cytochrome P450